MILLLPIVLVANWTDTPTGLDVNKLRTFPMTRVHAGTLKQGQSVTFDGIQAKAPEGPPEVVLRGTGKSGRLWTVRIFELDEVWKADLDNNGVADYVLLGLGPFWNGRLTPPYSVSILLMDADRMPVPFFESVYNREDAQAMKHFVDLDGDGRAEWIASRYHETGLDPHGNLFGNWPTSCIASGISPPRKSEGRFKESNSRSFIAGEDILPQEPIRPIWKTARQSPPDHPGRDSARNGKDCRLFPLNRQAAANRSK